MREGNILSYLPEVFKSIREMTAHAEAVNPEITALWEEIEKAYNDQYLYTMTENGVKRWEKMLKIEPMGTDTLEDRRFRIINRLNAQLPYTYRMLEHHMNQMCGEGGYTMKYTPEDWKLTVKVALTQKKQFAEILDLINTMIPANIVLDYDLLYNSYELLAGYTHEQLAAYTHGQLRNEVLS